MTSFVLLLSTQPATTARSRELVVAADGSASFRTVGAAVRRASAGDTIVLRPGVYREAITVDKDLFIRGEGDPRAVIIEAVRPTSFQEPGAIHFKRGRAVVRDLTIREPPADVPRYVGGLGPDPIDYAATRPTVLVSRGARATMRDLHLTGLARTAVAVEDPGARLRMIDNDLDGTGKIFIGPGATATLQGNEVDGYWSGVAVVGKGATAELRDNVIRDAETAIRFDGGATGEVVDNAIERVRTGIHVEGKGTDPYVRVNHVRDASFAGIAVLAGPDATIGGNSVIDSAVGVLVDDRVIDERYDEVVARAATAPLVRENVLHANGRGIVVAGGARPTLATNRIEDSASAAIDIAGAGTRPVVQDNILRGNAEDVRVSGGARPKLGGGSATDSTARAPERPETDIVVAADGSGDVVTIGEGIARAGDGDRVLIRPGTYAEEVVLRKSIELVGDGERDDIVVEVVQRPYPRPAVTVQDSRATLSGFTIRTDLPPGSRPPPGEEYWTAFQVLGGAPTIDDVSVKGETGLLVSDGSQATIRRNEIEAHGTAVTVLRGATPVITDNVIVGDAANGFETSVIVSGRQGRPEIRHNEIQGGLLLGFGAAPVVRANRIAGRVSILAAGEGTLVAGNIVNIDDGGGWPGITVSDCGARVEDNEVVGDPEAGIAVAAFGDGCERGDPVITGNTIRVSGVGIEVLDATSALISGNTIESGGPGIVLRRAGFGGSKAGPGPTVRHNVIHSQDTGIVVDPDIEPVLEDNKIDDGDAGPEARP